jgi:hypothetical protein
VIALGAHPYREGGDFELRFYRPPGIRVMAVSDWASLREALREADGPRHVLVRRNWLPDEGAFLANRCTVEWRLFPDVVEDIGLRPALERGGAVLLRCPAERAADAD